MNRSGFRLGLVAAAVAATVAIAPARALAWGGWHRGGPRVFIGVGAPVWGYPAYPYPYYPPYPYPYPYPAYYPPSPPPQPSVEVPQPSEPPAAEQPEQPEGSPTYGLVQLRGVPDGADIDLDGRFWLHADRLDDRWLALPEGSHELTIHVGGRTPVERRVQVAGGRNQVIRIPRTG